MEIFEAVDKEGECPIEVACNIAQECWLHVFRMPVDSVGVNEFHLLLRGGGGRGTK